MTKGPNYRIPFRRRSEGKTNYHQRLRLIQSGKTRLVVRVSNQHIVVSFNEAKIEGDITRVFVGSNHLKKYYGWNFSTSNLPSAYLTGFLAGMKAKKAGIEEAILDIGIPTHTNHIWAALKGVIDAGVEVPHGDIFSEEFDARIKGEHIATYSQQLSKDDNAAYKQKFSKVLKNKADPIKIADSFEKVKKEIEKKNA